MRDNLFSICFLDRGADIKYQSRFLHKRFLGPHGSSCNGKFLSDAELLYLYLTLRFLNIDWLEIYDGCVSTTHLRRDQSIKLTIKTIRSAQPNTCVCIVKVVALSPLGKPVGAHRHVGRPSLKRRGSWIGTSTFDVHVEEFGAVQNGRSTSASSYSGVYVQDAPYVMDNF